MSIFKRKIKNTFDVARDMGVDDECAYDGEKTVYEIDNHSLHMFHQNLLLLP